MLFPVLQILISFRVFLFFSYSVHFISLYSVISVVSQYSIFVIWIAVLFLLYAIVPDILKSLIVMAISKLDDEVEGNKEFLKDTSKILQIIDEYANGGFEIINRKLNKNVDYFYEHNVFIEDLLDG